MIGQPLGEWHLAGVLPEWQVMLSLAKHEKKARIYLHAPSTISTQPFIVYLTDLCSTSPNLSWNK